ncbi:pentatricopeptide repeat-containing protein At3g06430, chloroplastic-like [Dioscorea cayenensis subsp. rotundata]|uniref:Pentatricopeptide repeat-containing protein At3g06430, chloroplastic-like n=1 Tax=Dioscorea cayennensis subsp. rotundata TaxID=55577 RepID=A0AB40ASH3_DIOCR|nr:pentatricopeptide repeat-containing protein At3g06430, chloroplastic-like [Dioscorea cayenensis subsp. rotundata]
MAAASSSLSFFSSAPSILKPVSSSRASPRFPVAPRTRPRGPAGAPKKPYSPAPERHSSPKTKKQFSPVKKEVSSPAPKKRHWKEGEFPGVTDESILGSPRPPIKNLKKKLDDRNAAKAWVSTVTETLVDKIQKRQWEAALEVFENLREQPFYYPKAGTYMKLLVLLGKSGQAHRAQTLFDCMVEEGIEPTSELYTALLLAYCRCKLLDEAFIVLGKMKALPLCQPDVFTYSTLLKACVEASRFELVDALYQEMAERMVTPNTVTQNIVLGGYGRAGKFDEMEKVLSGMIENKDCKPDVWTMNIILGLFGNQGQVDVMEKWYEKFRSFGIEPESRTFNILIGAYGKKRMYNKMTSVLEYMRRLQFPWTTSTYNNVIEAFADVGDARNVELAFNQMRAEGMKADTKTFCCLINGYSNAGLFHKVVSSIQLAERLEVPANVSFYNAVISACAKAGDLMEMERVFRRMKDRHFIPDSMTYSILVNAYQKEGMNDKIFDLEQEQQKLSTPELVAA